MNIEDVIDGLKEVIINNSNLECEEDDTMIFTGIDHVSTDRDHVYIKFPGSTIKIHVEKETETIPFC